MEFKALFGAEDRTSDFGVSAIFHETKQKMAERHCEEFMHCHRYSRKGVHGEKRFSREGLDMCKALKEMLEDEKIEGRKEGEIIERLAIIKNLLREGVNQEFICRVTGCSQEEFISVSKG